MSVFLNVSPETGQYNHYSHLETAKTVISNCISGIPETVYLESVFDATGVFFYNRVIIPDRRIKNAKQLTSIVVME